MGGRATLKLSLLANTHAKMFGGKEPLEGAVQTALEVERRQCAPCIEVDREKFIQEVLQSSVTFKQTIIRNSRLPCKILLTCTFNSDKDVSLLFLHGTEERQFFNPEHYIICC